MAESGTDSTESVADWAAVRSIRRGVLILALATCATLASVSGASDAARRARFPAKHAIAAEVRLMLSITADAPTSGFRHGTEFLLYPICTSTVDSRYASAIATPFVHGKVAQPVWIYLHRVSRGYRILSIQDGDRAGTKPIELPRRAWTDLRRPLCQPERSLRKLLKIRSRHTEPDFKI